MNNILGKINKAYELEAKKTELAKHEVELSLADNVKKALSVYQANISKFGKELDNYYVDIRALEKTINSAKGNVNLATTIAQTLRKDEDKLNAELELVRKKIQAAKNDLGVTIDINDIVNLSSLQSANTISSGIQKDAADFVKYVNTLVKPTI